MSSLAGYRILADSVMLNLSSIIYDYQRSHLQHKISSDGEETRRARSEIPAADEKNVSPSGVCAAVIVVPRRQPILPAKKALIAHYCARYFVACNLFPR